MLKFLKDAIENVTYCIIPKIRGIQRSKPENDILHEIKDLILKGCKRNYSGGRKYY